MRNVLLRLIAIVEIGGGLFGLVALAQRVWLGRSGVGIVIAVLGVIVFALSVAAGVLLLEKRDAGVRLSRIVQLLQLPVIATPWFSYGLQIGAAAPLVLLVRSPLTLNMHLHVAEWHWRLALAGPHTWQFGLNLLALAAWLVLRMRRS